LAAELAGARGGQDLHRHLLRVVPGQVAEDGAERHVVDRVQLRQHGGAQRRLGVDGADEEARRLGACGGVRVVDTPVEELEASGTASNSTLTARGSRTWPRISAPAWRPSSSSTSVTGTLVKRTVSRSRS